MGTSGPISPYLRGRLIGGDQILRLEHVEALAESISSVGERDVFVLLVADTQTVVAQSISVLTTPPCD
jgi:hypothetical protein